MKKKILISSFLFACVFLVFASPKPENSSQGLTIERDNVGIILIDVQPSFVNIMYGEKEPVIERLEQLLVISDWFQIPLIATFEYPTEQKGWLPERLDKVFPKQATRLVKRTFNLCREPEVRSKVEELEKKQVVLAGCETDVCVLQSALGLLEMGYQVFLLEDCVFTNESHPAPALKRMYQAGVIPSTYKTFFYELFQTADRNDLPASWKERASSFFHLFKSPYKLTPWELKR